MPTEKARVTARKKRKRKTSPESDSLPKDEGETSSYIPVAKKVMYLICAIKVCIY